MTYNPLPLSALCGAALLLITALGARAALPLQTFESLLAGQPPGAPWQSSGLVSTVSDLDAAVGEHALVVPAPTTSSLVEVAIPALVVGDNPAFIDLWIKPVSRTLDLHAADHPAAGQPVEASGVLCLDGAQFLFQRQANRYRVLAWSRTAPEPGSWIPLGGIAGAPTDFEIEDTGGRAKDWLRLTVRRDLTANRYDVWINQRLVAIDLGLDRIPGQAEFRLVHRPSPTAEDGPLSPILVDDVQGASQHPLYPDTDRDAMPDAWESAYEIQLNPDQWMSVDVITPDRNADLDLDSVTKIAEYYFGSRPNHLDSDGDGIPDGVEIQHTLNPASRLDAAQDKDADGFSNLAEYQGAGNGNISAPPAGAISNVVYVKADHPGTQNGQYASPYRTLNAALSSPYLAAGGRIVVRGEGGPLSHVGPTGPTPLGNSNLSITRAVTLSGVNAARVELQDLAPFATVNITANSIAPVFVCENMTFHGGARDDGGVFRIIGTPGAVLVRHCRFTESNASDDGGAIYGHAARLTIEDSWFEGCWAGGEGGAVHLEGGSQATIRRTQFQYNDSSTDGGALSLRGATASPIAIENCVFNNNFAARGSALATTDGADANWIQSTVAYNTGSQAGTGAALYATSTASALTASGCLFWQNTAGGIAHSHLSGGSHSFSYSTLSGWTTATGPAGTGNNGTDPVFRANSLLPSSTAMMDSSNPAHNHTTDFLNNARWDAPGGTTGTLADRGAFERQPDTDVDGMSDDFEARYAFNPADPSDGDADADQDGYSNLEESTDKTDPRNPFSVKAPAVFVNAATGKDWHPGPSLPAGTPAITLQGTRNHPFQSIRRAILACPVNRRIVLADGTYSGPGNTNLKLTESWSWTPHLSTHSLTSSLSLDGKTIRGLNNATRTILDGGGTSRLFDLALSTGGPARYVTLNNLTLRRGSADLGGAIKATGNPGIGHLTLKKCILAANRATSAGGALHITGAGLALDGCTLYGNDAPRGGALALVDLSPLNTSAVSTASLTQCRFAYNMATAVNGTLGQGGAISVHASSMTTSQTRFEFNHAQRHGGAVALLSFNGYYPISFGAGTHFQSNAADLRGGAVYTENAAFLATGLSFVANRAGTAAGTGEGGAWFCAHPATGTTTSLGYSSRTAQLNNCRFLQNYAGSRGGAVAIADASPLFTNCAFAENSADSQVGNGGAVAVFWETPAPTTPAAPAHPSAPRFVHPTFTRNHAALAGNLSSQSLTTPWLINGLCSDGFLPPLSPSLLGPRHLHGCQIAAPDSLISTAESDPARRNLFATPTLAFDWIHLASPVRLPADTSSTSGGVEPSVAVSFTRPTTDIDNESRPAAAGGKFTLCRGCDEPRDADADSLPDWFESLAAAFSPLDGIATLAHTHPLHPATTSLPSALPTNNADADTYTLTQELVHGGRPDAPESHLLGRDSDGDGLSDLFENLTPGFDWKNPDINNDGILDGWAYRHFSSLTVNTSNDDDGDGLNNGLEAEYGLNPRSADSDSDGVPDPWETATGSDPLDADSDDNGQPDTWNPLPHDFTGTTAPGLHQPTASEPWYVEHAWSYFQFNPGSYFYPPSMDLLSWGLDTMNTESDFLIEPIRPIPNAPNINFRDFCRTLTNLLGPHTMIRPTDRIRPSLADVETVQNIFASPRFFPLTQTFDVIPPEVTSLIGQQRTQAWANQWFAAVQSAHHDGYTAWTSGRARQQWIPHNFHYHIQHKITRVVPSFRLRCTHPAGSPGHVQLNFIRVRARAARHFTYTDALNLPILAHPLHENFVSFEPVTLTLAPGQTVGNTITLNPQQPTLLSANPPNLPSPLAYPFGYPIDPYFDLIQFDALLPFDLIAHQRGTPNSPGPRTPLGYGTYGQAITLMENADYESAVEQTRPDYDVPGDMTPTRRNLDDDLAKIIVRWPIGIDPALFNLRLTSAGFRQNYQNDDQIPVMEVTSASNLRFYSADGVRLASPDSSAGSLQTSMPTVFAELRDNGQSTLYVDAGRHFGVIEPLLGPTRGAYAPEITAEADDSAQELSGSIIGLEASINSRTTTQNSIVFKGGFWRFSIPVTRPPLPPRGVAGQLEFWDGKGRITENETDIGQLVASFSARSGITRGDAANQRGGGGHIPTGWYYLYRRTDFGRGQPDHWRTINGITTINQGSYVRWRQDDALSSDDRYTNMFAYNSSYSRDRRVGLPVPIMFKWQIHPIPPNNAFGRQHLQIHPDGKRNGTLGCIGIQTYEDCVRVRRILQNYHQLKLNVETTNNR